MKSVWLPCCLIVGCLILPVPGLAQAKAQSAKSMTASPAPPRALVPPTSLVPPTALCDATVAVPRNIPALPEPMVVQVMVSIDSIGAVQQVRLVSPAPNLFTDLVLQHLSRCPFTPAQQNGQAIASMVRMEQLFSPALLPPPEEVVATASLAMLQGSIVERGTRHAVLGARVTAKTPLGDVVVDSDADGNFQIEGAAGTWQVMITVPGYRDFTVHETVAKDDIVAVRYRMQRLGISEPEQDDH